MSQPQAWWKRLLSRSVSGNTASANNGYGAPDLINEIRKVRLPFGYAMWSIGVTDDLYGRRQHLANPANWQAWPVESAKAARYVLRHFAGRGMHCESQDTDQGRFVYIYLVEEWRRATAA